MGAVFVLLIYFLILTRLIQNAQTAADISGTFLIMGVVAVLIFQIAVNVGMVPSDLCGHRHPFTLNELRGILGVVAHFSWLWVLR